MTKSKDLFQLIAILSVIIWVGSCAPKYRLLMGPSLVEKSFQSHEKISGTLGLYIDPIRVKRDLRESKNILEVQQRKGVIGALNDIFYAALSPLFDKMVICPSDPLINPWQLKNFNFFARVMDFEILCLGTSSSKVPNITVKFTILFYSSKRELIKKINIYNESKGRLAFQRAFEELRNKIQKKYFVKEEKKEKKIILTFPIKGNLEGQIIEIEKKKTLKIPSELNKGMQLFKEGKSALHEPNLEKAVDKFQKAIDFLTKVNSSEVYEHKKNDLLIKSYCFLAYIYTGLNDIQKAKEELYNLSKIDPNFTIPKEIRTPQLECFINEIKKK